MGGGGIARKALRSAFRVVCAGAGLSMAARFLFRLIAGLVAFPVFTGGAIVVAVKVRFGSPEFWLLGFLLTRQAPCLVP